MDMSGYGVAVSHRPHNGSTKTFRGTVEAHEFVLIDSRGSKRAILGYARDYERNPVTQEELAIREMGAYWRSEDIAGLFLNVSEGPAAICLQNEGGTRFAELRTAPTASTGRSDGLGQTSFVIFGRNEEPRVVIETDSKDSRQVIKVCGERGKPYMGLKITGDGITVEVQGTQARPKLRLLVKDESGGNVVNIEASANPGSSVTMKGSGGELLGEIKSV